MEEIRRRLTYANVMSSIAVFLVLGGAAVAASQLPKNSVGTPQLKKNAVRTGKVAPEAIRAGKLAKNAVPANRLRDGAVITAKLADGSVITGKLADLAVSTAKLADNAATSAKIAPDAVGTTQLAPNSVSTAKLAPGAVTASRFGGAVFTLGPNVAVGAGATSATTLDCPAGRRMLSGGPLNSGNNKDLVMIGSHPNNPNQWRVQMHNSGAAVQNYRIVVLCLLP